MKTSDIIKNAILSEKAYKLMEKGIYTFMVGKGATKSEIAKKVATQFGVKVIKVNLASVPSKTKRVQMTRKTTSVGGGKKALVYLQSGQTIAMLSPKAKSKDSKKTKEVKK